MDREVRKTRDKWKGPEDILQSSTHLFALLNRRRLKLDAAVPKFSRSVYQTNNSQFPCRQQWLQLATWLIAWQLLDPIFLLEAPKQSQIKVCHQNNLLSAMPFSPLVTSSPSHAQNGCYVQYQQLLASVLKPVFNKELQDVFYTTVWEHIM